jgi:hypothetical protein
VQTVPEVGVTNTRGVIAELLTLLTHPFVITLTAGPVKTDATEPQPVKPVLHLTVRSIDSNLLFISCQLYLLRPLYSFCVCPVGQTVAEITETHATHTTDDVLAS